MKKGIMIHYLPIHAPIDWTKYKEVVKEEHTDFKHLFFPTETREGIEVLIMPETEKEGRIL